jgi:hypothetical protein
MDNLIQNGSIVGIALLFVNMAVFSQISSRTKAQRGDYDTMDQELNQWLGDASKNPILNFVVALTGGGATIWLPIYVGLWEGVWYGLASFVAFLFLSTFLGNLIFKTKLFPTVFSICAFTGVIGLYLTIASLVN